MADISELTPETVQALLQLHQELTNKDGRQTILELPEEIFQDLEDATPQELQTNLKRFSRNQPNYTGRNWTRSGAINEAFTSELKKCKTSSYQVCVDRHQDSEKLRVTGKAVTELYQELTTLQEGTPILLLGDTIEKARRLAVFSYGSGKTIDKQVKRVMAQELHLLDSVRHLGHSENEEKDLAFSEEDVDRIQQARFDEAILRQYSSNRGRGFYNSNGRGFFNSNGRGYRGTFYRGNANRGHFFGRGHYRGGGGPQTLQQQKANNPQQHQQ